ncbi:MAG: hypothetical protein LBH68_00640, partial [Bifidobacteriaceae bacterium]|nr:hypothetical protein [Bifidobacteriaceae bacterium]
MSEEAKDQAAADAPSASGTDLTSRGTVGAGPEVTEVRHGAFGVHGTGDTSGFGGLTRVVEIPGSSPRPYGGWFDAAVDLLAEDLSAAG